MLKIVSFVAMLAAVRAGAPLGYNSPAYTVRAAAPLGYAPGPQYAPAPVAFAHAAPAYQQYSQYAPVVKKVAPLAQVVKTVSPEPYDSHPQYNYGYSVSDQLTGDQHSAHESRDGDLVKGQYSLVEPDGSVRTVTYTADSINGFNAVVERSAPTVLKQHAAPIKAVHQYAPQVAAHPVRYAPQVHQVAAHPVQYAPQVHQVAAHPVQYAPQAHQVQYAPQAHQVQYAPQAHQVQYAPQVHQVAAHPVQYAPQVHQVAAHPVRYAPQVHQVAAHPVQYAPQVHQVAAAHPVQYQQGVYHH